MRIALILFFLLSPFGPWAGVVGFAVESRTIERMIEATDQEAGQQPLGLEREERFKLGKTYYRRFCVHCHSETGKGNGRAADYLSPSPRDLSLGLFKFRSTATNTLPLDRDLFRTIKWGVPGTAMPAWGRVFADEILDYLVEYIKVFSDRFKFEKPDFEIDPGLEPPFDSLSVEVGKSLYRELRCGRCHGEKGEKRGPLEDRLKDSWGQPSLVYNLRQPGLYKAGAAAGEIYKTLVSGMDGTAMSAYDYLLEEETWHLVHFLQSGFENDVKVRPGELIPGAVISHRVPGKLGTSLDDPVWESATSHFIELLPLRARELPAETLQIQSVHDGERIAFRLRWQDPTRDGPGPNFQGYVDAAALQFPLQTSPLMDLPFFGMGEQGKPVNIWHWKADASQVEEDGGLVRSSAAGGSPRADNMSLDPFREAPVEEINAEGFGTLSVQSLEDQQLSGHGRWRDGVWEVIFVRNLETPGPRDIRFQSPGGGYLSAALWDGKKKDRNANKRISLWQVLTVE